MRKPTNKVQEVMFWCSSKQSLVKEEFVGGVGVMKVTSSLYLIIVVGIDYFVYGLNSKELSTGYI